MHWIGQIPLGLGGGDAKLGSSFILLISSSIAISNISSSTVLLFYQILYKLLINQSKYYKY